MQISDLCICSCVLRVFGFTYCVTRCLSGQSVGFMFMRVENVVDMATQYLLSGWKGCLHWMSTVKLIQSAFFVCLCAFKCEGYLCTHTHIHVPMSIRHVLHYQQSLWWNKSALINVEGSRRCDYIWEANSILSYNWLAMTMLCKEQKTFLQQLLRDYEIRKNSCWKSPRLQN